jgi:hypothetical protein
MQNLREPPNLLYKQIIIIFRLKIYFKYANNYKEISLHVFYSIICIISYLLISQTNIKEKFCNEYTFFKLYILEKGFYKGTRKFYN